MKRGRGVEIRCFSYVWLWSFLFSLFSFSARALNVLNSAKDLVQSLDEADNAQKKAKSAIEQANDDITSARADLEEVH